MNHIQRIDGYHKLPGVGQPSPTGAEKRPPAAAVDKSEDQVQISDKAVYLSKIAALPDIRQEKVDTIKQAISKGIYDVEGKLSPALDRFLDEYVV